MLSRSLVGPEDEQRRTKYASSSVPARQVCPSLIFLLLTHESRQFSAAQTKDFERMTPYVRDLRKKQYVTAQSLEKIEDGSCSLRLSDSSRLSCLSLAAYAIAIRSSEYDLSQDILDDIVARSVSGYASAGSIKVDSLDEGDGAGF